MLKKVIINTSLVVIPCFFFTQGFSQKMEEGFEQKAVQYLSENIEFRKLRRSIISGKNQTTGKYSSYLLAGYSLDIVYIHDFEDSLYQALSAIDSVNLLRKPKEKEININPLIKIGKRPLINFQRRAKFSVNVDNFIYFKNKVFVEIFFERYDAEFIYFIIGFDKKTGNPESLYRHTRIY
jgi:hypothetical protein